MKPMPTRKTHFALVTAVVVLGILGYMAYMWTSGAQRSAVVGETQRAGHFEQACGGLDRSERIPDCVSYYNDTLEVVYADKSGKWPFTGGPDQPTYASTYRKLEDKVAIYNSRASDPSGKLDLHSYP